jgi:hypothetical protein
LVLEPDVVVLVAAETAPIKKSADSKNIEKIINFFLKIKRPPIILICKSNLDIYFFICGWGYLFVNGTVPSYLIHLIIFS